MEFCAGRLAITWQDQKLRPHFALCVIPLPKNCPNWIPKGFVVRCNRSYVFNCIQLYEWIGPGNNDISQSRHPQYSQYQGPVKACINVYMDNQTYRLLQANYHL